VKTGTFQIPNLLPVKAVANLKVLSFSSFHMSKTMLRLSSPGSKEAARVQIKVVDGFGTL